MTLSQLFCAAVELWAALARHNSDPDERTPISFGPPP